MLVAFKNTFSSSDLDLTKSVGIRPYYSSHLMFDIYLKMEKIAVHCQLCECYLLQANHHVCNSENIDSRGISTLSSGKFSDFYTQCSKLVFI